MRIVAIDFMSLDGVVQAPGGAEEDTEGGFTHGGWSMPFFDPEVMGAAIDEATGAADALLFGRRTWQSMAAAWPGRAGDPFADRMNSARKYVVSRTLTPADVAAWENSTLLPGDDAVGAVRALRAQGGGDALMWGSSALARTLLGAGLVDELRLMIEPILLGGGKRIFPEDGEARPLELVDVRRCATGVLVCTYRPAGAA